MENAFPLLSFLAPIVGDIVGITLLTALAFLGIFAFWVCGKLYIYLKRNEEVSMVSFLFKPKKVSKEMDLLFKDCVICFLASFFYLLNEAIYLFDINVLYDTSLFLPVLLLTDILPIVSFFLPLVFALLLIKVLYRWVREFAKYS